MEKGKVAARGGGGEESGLASARLYNDFGHGATKSWTWPLLSSLPNVLRLFLARCAARQAAETALRAAEEASGARGALASIDSAFFLHTQYF